jgi:hypothetical protein
MGACFLLLTHFLLHSIFNILDCTVFGFPGDQKQFESRTFSSISVHADINISFLQVRDIHFYGIEHLVKLLGLCGLRRVCGGYQILNLHIYT